ncbi:hypothetical protein A5724_19560 [Mycobacterium sp. ACS1612]|uniref:hypothetical protein n=1 Tax=Mycobacterium sp. ACS1612 TaxID=1834117 RepID=UPI0008014545|nr:hypothetical protein [Mycobacterium sp. ACS1612]OBF33268.1 hypothetical protein A5724_19560 [Mycobacterium sp. ACS1612]
MSGLADAARDARAAAELSDDAGTHALAAVLEASVAAAAREQLAELTPEPDLSGLPSATEAGYVPEVRIPGPGTNPPGSPEWWTG